MCFQLKDEATTGTALTTLSASVHGRRNVKNLGGDILVQTKRHGRVALASGLRAKKQVE